MLSAQQIQIVKSTVPLLENAGVTITNHFYNRMFNANPELMNIFNMSNQVNGKQQFALFSAVASYAKHIDNLGALTSIVERVAHKHASFLIEPAHYDIVGHHLIATLKELAPDEFTEPVADAWTAAYSMLGGILMGREKELYQSNEEATGGWKGARQFMVHEKIAESELVYSFVLTPKDGGSVVTYEPGQYLGIRVRSPKVDYVEIRQYSLSDKPNSKSYRISVKREELPQPGVVSNYLHDHIQVGDVLDVMPPGGDFYLKSDSIPTVLISAGVGQTPMIAMLETLASKNATTPIWYLHACENPAQHSFADRVVQLKQFYSHLNHYTWYNQPQDLQENQFNGLMKLVDIADELPLQTGQYYLCGPTGFMKFVKDQLLELGVKPSSIHYEVFGPHSDF